MAIYYQAHRLILTMNWTDGSQDQNNPYVIPATAQTWQRTLDGTTWGPNPGPLQRVWAPGNKPSPIMNFLASVTFPTAQTAAPQSMALSVNASKQGNGQPGEGNDPFVGPVPIMMIASQSPSSDNITFQYSVSSPPAINKNGDFHISVAISVVDAARNTRYWRVDGEMDVSTRLFYSQYALKWTMNWADGSTDSTNPFSIPATAENWLIYDTVTWSPSPDASLNVWAPRNQTNPLMNFLAYVTFPAAQTATPPNLTLSVNASKKGNGQSGQGNDPFVGAVPITMPASPSPSSDGITFQYSGSSAPAINKNGDFEISVAISAVTAAGTTLYWTIDPEMDVTTDG